MQREEALKKVGFFLWYFPSYAPHAARSKAVVSCFIFGETLFLAGIAEGHVKSAGQVGLA